MPKAITRYCKRCNRPYYGHKSKVYCSAECRRAVYRSPWNKGKKGLPANRPKNGKTKACLVCGKEFYTPKSALSKKHCSPECYYKARWDKSHVETRECAICGKEFQTFRSNKKDACNPACTTELRSQSLQGDKSHFWRGGKTAPYHKKWKQVRRKALKRDGYKCTLCDATNDLIVHHIVPYRYSKSHALDNLQTLCRTCHGSEEYKANIANRKALAEGRRIRLEMIQADS